MVSRHIRIRLLMLAAIAGIAGAVWLAADSQRAAGDNAFAEAQSAQSMRSAMLEQHSAALGYLATRSQHFLNHYREGRSTFEAAVAAARVGAPIGEDDEREAIAEQQELAHRYEAQADGLIAAASGAPGGNTKVVASRLDALVDRFLAVNREFLADLEGERRDNQANAVTLTVSLIVLLGGVFGGLGYLIVDRRARRDGRRQDRHSRFAEVLQLARSEDEAYAVVKKHLEKLVPGSRATVLGRNNSANRLEPRTQVEGTVLTESLEGAEPEACIAIRGGKPHQSSEADELMACEVCGEVGGKTTCVPALVGGEVIGSVLIEHPRALVNGDSDAVSASITESAPIVANLRNLAIAELRAATDALTGLPNNRSIQETLKRMSAQAGRTLSPLAVVLFDLDHFKQVNDSHGHSKGDEVLAVVSDTVASRLRASDFVGRYGGEEFLALLPDTGREDALALAETLREAVCEIDVPGVTQSISASFGVAVMPDEAGEPAEIVRVADRALYTAKSLGRNRVATAVDSEVAAVATGNGTPS